MSLNFSARLIGTMVLLEQELPLDGESKCLKSQQKSHEKETLRHRDRCSLNCTPKAKVGMQTAFHSASYASAFEGNGICVLLNRALEQGKDVHMCLTSSTSSYRATDLRRCWDPYKTQTQGYLSFLRFAPPASIATNPTDNSAKPPDSSGLRNIQSILRNLSHIRKQDVHLTGMVHF